MADQRFSTLQQSELFEFKCVSAEVRVTYMYAVMSL